MLRFSSDIENTYHGVYCNIKKILQYRTTDMFSHIEIQTITSCNRRCPICPVSKYPQFDKRMEQTLFEKIIEELRTINYKGIISPHFYGEPLMDNRMLSLMQYTRKNLPKAKLAI